MQLFLFSLNEELFRILQFGTCRHAEKPSERGTLVRMYLNWLCFLYYDLVGDDWPYFLDFVCVRGLRSIREKFWLEQRKNWENRSRREKEDGGYSIKA